MRTKLVFALVGLALASMLALGWVSYTLAGRVLTQDALLRLEAVAESKHQDVESMELGWEDRVRLVASRTQLRITLSEYNESPTVDSRNRMVRILTDAMRSVPTFRRLVLYGIDGEAVAWTDSDETGTLPEEWRGRDPGSVAFQGLRWSDDGDASAGLVAPLDLDGAIAGWVEVTMAPDELFQVARDTTGLGDTGEILVVLQQTPDSGLVFSNFRHREEGEPQRRFAIESDRPVALALAGRDTVTESAVDYRGQRVWAAARSLQDLGLGVLVKQDAEEALEPVRGLRSELFRVGLALSAFGVLIGTLLGWWFGKPVQDLADVAERIRKGDLEARADASREDEIGFLADTFNRMAERLIATNRELERRIAVMEETGSDADSWRESDAGGRDPLEPDASERDPDSSDGA